jgi:hypothetical protein
MPPTVEATPTAVTPPMKGVDFYHGVLSSNFLAAGVGAAVVVFGTMIDAETTLDNALVCDRSRSIVFTAKK